MSKYAYTRTRHIRDVYAYTYTPIRARISTALKLAYTIFANVYSAVRAVGGCSNPQPPSVRPLTSLWHSEGTTPSVARAQRMQAPGHATEHVQVYYGMKRVRCMHLPVFVHGGACLLRHVVDPALPEGRDLRAGGARDLQHQGLVAGLRGLAEVRAVVAAAAVRVVDDDQGTAPREGSAEGLFAVGVGLRQESGDERVRGATWGQRQGGGHGYALSCGGGGTEGEMLR